MPGKSPFRDDWLACMRAHYAHVIRTNDTVTERTLRGVLLSVGFSESELTEIYVTASMHVDQVGADFTPDPAVIEALAQQAAEIIAQPPEAVTQETLEILAEAAAEISEEVFESRPDEDDVPPPDSPTQLSLF
jgi:hypothetical protein